MNDVGQVTSEQPPSEHSTIEEWARAYVESTSLAYKCAPPPPPGQFADQPLALDLRPGRPPELRVSAEKPRSVTLGALRDPKARARLIHKFWHHELQAAELMAWCLLRFVDAPEEFRRGLVRIMRDEIRHMGLYEEHLQRLGYGVGAFPVRDWFWERVASTKTPLSFVALLGMGLEGANLEHTARFAAWFRTVGDEPGAESQEQIGREEVAHVRFATRWFRQWTGGVDFETWCRELPPPLTPVLLRGKTLRRDLREKAEMPAEFLDQLSAWRPAP